MHMGLRSALFGSALPLAGFELGMDFRAGWYRSGAVVTRDPAALPGYSFARAGAKFEDVGGVLMPVAANTPAIIPGVGFIARPGYTNAIANSAFAGAVAGNPGSGPTKMQIATVAVGNGISRQVAATGTDPATGIPYIDYRFFGTANAAAIVYPMLSHAAATEAPVSAAGDIWTASLGFVLLPGAVLGTARISLTFDSRNDEGNTIGSSNSVPLVTDGVIVPNLPRVSKTSAVLPANNSVRMWMFLSISLRQGETYDFTMRLSAPSLVKSAILGPYIPTTNGAVTVNSDRMYVDMAEAMPEDHVILTSVMHPALGPGSGNAFGHASLTQNTGFSTANSMFMFMSNSSAGSAGIINSGTGVYRSAARITAPPERLNLALRRTGGTFTLFGRSPSQGTQVANAAPVAQPADLRRLLIGCNGGLGEHANATVEFVGYRRGVFSDAQVAGMLAALA